MLPSEAPRTRTTADTVFVLTVSRGLASPRTREFRVGEPQDAASVGSSGDWQLRGPGVEPIHAYLYFDGETLYVQSALAERDLICGGQRVGNDWEPVAVSDVLEIGTARITLTQTTQVQSGASAVLRAPEQAPHDPVDVAPERGSAPALHGMAPGIVISPEGADAVTGEERTAFLPLPNLESQPQLQALDDDDDHDLTRFPGVVPSYAGVGEEEEPTRMVSLEGKSAVGVFVPEPVVGEDPYDDLQERTHAASGASAVVPYRPDTALPHTPTGALQLGSARDVAAAAQRLAATGPSRLPEIQPYGGPPPAREPSAAQPRQAEPAPHSYPTPEPRAGWGGELLKSDASRARASAEIFAASGGQRAAPQPAATGAEASMVSRSIGEMTRVAPLGPEAEAARKAAVAHSSSVAKARPADVPSVLTSPVPLGSSERKAAPTAETKRRKQKTARVRGPDGSGGYTPPPPPMALPQEEPKGKADRPPSGLKKAFDSFADHFEEVNALRKVLYLSSPFLLLTAAYVLFGPDPPPPSSQGTPIKALEPSAPLVVPSAPPEEDRTLARPDGTVVRADPEPDTPDAGAPVAGKRGAKGPKTLTMERLAADAYAAGQLEKAIGLYRQVLEAPDTDPARAVALAEVLRILEAKKATGKHETLQQAEPPKSAR